METSSAPTRNHLDQLDALRGIAILGVYFVHATLLVNPGRTLGVLGGSGQRGVQLFYTISAFTLCLSLDSPRREQHRLRNFYLRRFFRIAPLFYVVFALNFGASSLGPAYSTFRFLNRTDVLLGLLLMHGLSPHAINFFVNGGWSVAVEVMFYMLLPALWRYFHTTVRLIVLLAVSAPGLYLICSYLGTRSTNGLNREYFTFLWFPVEFPVFVMGMLSYSVWKNWVSGHSAKPQAETLISLTLLLVSGMVFLAGLPIRNGTLYVSSFAFVPLQLALLIRPWQLLVNPVTRYLGKISYSMYLVHIFLFPFIVHALNHYAPGFFSEQVIGKDRGVCIIFVLILAITLPVCSFTYFFIEQPGIRLGRRLIDGSESRARQVLI